MTRSGANQPATTSTPTNAQERDRRVAGDDARQRLLAGDPGHRATAAAGRRLDRRAGGR